MKKILLPVILLFLAGCDYKIPLSQTAGAPANPALAGTWIETSTNSKPVSMEFKISGTDYNVTYTETSTETNIYTFKGFEIHAAGLNLIQLAWQESDVAESKETYIYAKYELNSEGLTVYRLNTAVVSAKCQTTEELLNDINVHRQNPFLFKEPLKFTKSAQQ